MAELMRKIENNMVGIDQGDVVLFSDFEHDGDMWTGEGPRGTRVAVLFSEPYAIAPNVFVALSMLDVSNTSNTRQDVQAEDISLAGFYIVFRTWGDTKVARARVAWQSIGPIASEDDWDL